MPVDKEDTKNVIKKAKGMNSKFSVGPSQLGIGSPNMAKPIIGEIRAVKTEIGIITFLF